MRAIASDPISAGSAASDAGALEGYIAQSGPPVTPADLAALLHDTRHAAERTSPRSARPPGGHRGGVDRRRIRRPGRAAPSSRIRHEAS